MGKIDWSQLRTAADKIAEQVQREIEKKERDAKGLAENIVILRTIDKIIEELPDSEVEQLTYLYPEWSGAGVNLPKDKKLRRNGKLYRVLQGHVTQPDWTPETAHSLFVPFRDPETIPDWQLPQGSHDAPNTGDRVRHNDLCWQSKIDANTTEPGSDPRWWEEIDCP